MYTFCLLFTTDSLLVCPEFTGLRVPYLLSRSLPSPEWKLLGARHSVYLLLTQHLESP